MELLEAGGGTFSPLQGWKNGFLYVSEMAGHYNASQPL